MHAQLLHNTGSLPWPHLNKKGSGYQAPPQIIGANQQPSLATEAGVIITDENGNAIQLEK